MSELRKLQLLQKDILDFLVDICNKYDLVYWLDFGTLLGAVRHKGFIPWDDDVDIAMERESYQKLQIIFDTRLKDSKYELKFYENEKFLKIIDKNSFIEDTNGNKINVWIDIFPFDFYSKKNFINFIDKHFIEIHKFKEDKTFKRKFFNIIIGLKKSIYKKIISKRIFINFFLDKKEKNYTGHGIECNFKINLNKKSDIYPLKKYEFEGGLYWGPKNSDVYLKKMYGDYKKLPSKKDRKAHLSLNKIILKEKIWEDGE